MHELRVLLRERYDVTHLDDELIRELREFAKQKRQTTAFVSGHMRISDAEFEKHYVPLLQEAMAKGHHFVVGDANGVDIMTQEYLWINGIKPVTVYHMFERPRHNPGYTTKGGFETDDNRDAAMTAFSDYDIAWVRPGRETSGTARNLKRRIEGVGAIGQVKYESPTT